MIAFKRFSIVFGLVFMSASFSSYAMPGASLVTIDAAGWGQFSYKERPRLTEVLNTIDNAEPMLYWPAARLYLDDALSHYSFERKRQQLTEKLMVLAQQHGAGQVVTPLLEVVKSARLATPIQVSLDPDAVSARADLNPLLDNGLYLLRVTRRPSELSILGFAGSHQIAHQYQRSVRDYSMDLPFDALAEQNQLYVLGADLSVSLVNRSLWAASKQEIRPGSLLYIPLDESSLPKTFQGFNQMMIEFLQHRVVGE